MKSRREVLSQPYVNINDIRQLLKVPKDKARRIYQEVDAIESKKEFRPHENKVLLQNVLKATGISYSFLERQIREEIC